MRRRPALETNPDGQAFFEACDAGYELWNEARAEVLTGKTVNLSAAIAHMTSGAAHTFRAVDLVLGA